MSLKNINGWMVSSTDRIISRKIKNVKDGDVLYEKDQRDFLIKQIKHKDVFVDVGANIGIWTRPMSYKFKKVISLEPAERNLAAFRYNVAGISNVELIEKGAGDIASENVQFHNTVKNCGGIKLASISGRPNGEIKENDFTADIITIDSLELEECDLIKIDVEGYEYQVLKGAEKTLKRCNPWIYVEKNTKEDLGFSHEKVDELISSIGGYKALDSKLCAKNAIYYPVSEQTKKLKAIEPSQTIKPVNDLSQLNT